MAKKIKLPLEMANGISVRTMEELKENWDLEKVITYYHNGRLLTWLNDRYYSELAEQVQALSAVSDTHALQKQLCDIFGMPFTEEETVDMEAVAERNRRLEALRQITADDEILKNVDKVAFNQEELADLLDEGEPVIYLVNNTFAIPLSEKNKKYIGIGEVTAIINSTDPVDFEALNIGFQKIKLGGSFEDLKEINKAELEEAEQAFLKERYSYAFHKFQKLAEGGNGRAMYFLGEYYRYGFGNVVPENKDTGFTWHKLGGNRGYALAGLNVAYSYPKGSPEREEIFKKYFEPVKALADSGDVIAQNEIADMYASGYGVDKNIDKAIDYLKKSVDNGYQRCQNKLGNMYYNANKYEDAFFYYQLSSYDNSDSMNSLGNMYYSGIFAMQSYTLAVDCFARAAKMGNRVAMYNLANMYYNGEGVQKDYYKAVEWYRKSADLGYSFAMNSLGNMYRDGKGVEINIGEARRLYQMAADLGNETAKDSLTKMNKMDEEQYKSQNDDSCFITTAVCSSLNKPDDCDELMTMRWYRDKLKSEDPDMTELIKEYYRVAPGVVKKIDQESDAPDIYRGLWENSISRIYRSLKQEDYRDATLRYIDMFESLCGKFDTPLSPDILRLIRSVRLRN